MRRPRQIRTTGESWWWLAVAFCVLVASSWMAGYVVAAGPSGSDLVGKLEGP
jgi:hypothetical protein